MSATLRRRLVLLVTLLLTLWAAWEVSQPEVSTLNHADNSVSSFKQVPTTRKAPVEMTFSGDLRFPTRPEYASPVTDLFELPKPPEPSVVVSIPVAPMTPPLPYVYLGRLEEAASRQIFLAEGNNTMVVGVGTRLSGGWTLESIESGRLVFVYEPLGQKQSLQIREN